MRERGERRVILEYIFIAFSSFVFKSCCRSVGRPFQDSFQDWLAPVVLFGLVWSPLFPTVSSSADLLSVPAERVDDTFIAEVKAVLASNCGCEKEGGWSNNCDGVCVCNIKSFMMQTLY